MTDRVSRFAKGWPAVFVVGIVLTVLAMLDAPSGAGEPEPPRGTSWVVPVGVLVVLLAAAGVAAFFVLRRRRDR